MTVYDATIAKIKQLPESLADEVGDFVDFLSMRRDSARWRLWTQFAESLKVTESDFGDYLSNLEGYENRLANGEIKW